MKMRKLLYLLIFLVIEMPVYAQQDVDIEILRLKTGSRRIRFDFVNRQADTLYYYVSLEHKEGIDWKEAVTDVSADPGDPGTTIFSMPPGLVIKNKYTARSLFPSAEKEPDREYRFKIIYGKDVDTMNRQLFSNPF